MFMKSNSKFGIIPSVNISCTLEATAMPISFFFMYLTNRLNSAFPIKIGLFIVLLFMIPYILLNFQMRFICQRLRTRLWNQMHLDFMFTPKLKYSIRQVILLLYVDFNISKLRSISTFLVY